MKLTTKLKKDLIKEDVRLISKICECSPLYVRNILNEKRETKSELAKRILNVSEATIEMRMGLQEYFRKNPDANLKDEMQGFSMFFFPKNKKEKEILEQMKNWILENEYMWD